MPSEEQKSVFLQELDGDTPKSPKDQKPKKKHTLAFFVTTVVLFLIIIALFIFIMSAGGSGNPILKTFGVPEDGAKSFLLKLVNGTFATFGVILLFTVAINLFLALSTKEKLKRSGFFIFSGVSTGLMFLVVVVWLGMWNYINRFVVEASGFVAAIEVNMDKDELKNIKAPVNVEFSATKIKKAIENSGFKIQGFKWDFGEGFGKIQPSDTIVHHFSTAGDYVVRVEIVTEDGISEIFELRDRVFKITEADFSATPEEGSAPLKVEFDATNISKGIRVSSYSWDFDGDGKTDEETKSPRIEHVFSKIGTYNVKLYMMDYDNNVKSFDKIITVKGESKDRMQSKINIIQGQAESTIPFKVVFSGEESSSIDSDIVSYTWKFNDGKPNASGQVVSHIFDQAGVYNVELIIKNAKGVEKSNKITIEAKKPLDPPSSIIKTQPEFDANHIITGFTPLSVNFDGSSSKDKDSNIISYEWDFNKDGITDETGDKIGKKVFREPGEYNISLKVVDSDGNEDTSSVKIIVQEEKLNAVIKADPETGSVPLTVNFDASESWCTGDDCSISSYEWDFDDGSKAHHSGASVKHMYSQVGSYEVKLTVFTNEGESKQTTKMIYAREMPLVSCFAASRTHGDAPLTVSFDPSCSSGPITTYEWEFGDGVKRTTRRPTYTFQEAGKYEILLRVIDDKNNISEKIMEIVAEPKQESNF
ncbi:MAG: PKD domain-containing protein [Candidatus Gracilibacteria bacterium]|jgi:PKD repeat protein|nr:PKD domain-containing protein [Candidatus Gracilibacteria bacterium]